ncbi:MAG TPA: Rho termination factor N-terminal domain-containing protein [Pseudonocardiaceae bacterium]
MTIPSARRASEPTRAELYRVAQERGIEGRSKMTKEELRRALGES